MHRTPLSGAILEDVFGPFDKNVRRTPRNRRQNRDTAKRNRRDFQIEALENREVPAIDATIAATSLGSTAGNNAAIGEVVRVRAVVALPNDFSAYTPDAITVASTLPAGMRYLDGTAKIALISDGGLSSTLGSGAYVNGSSAAGVTPTFGITPVLSNGQLVFQTGITALQDDDANGEYAVIEYNALVENVMSNQAGTQLTVGFALSVGAAGVTDIAAAGVSVVEPQITDLLKSVNRSTARTGDTVTYTLTFSNSSTNATAYNLAVLDNVPNGLQLNPNSVVVVGGSGMVNRSTATTVAVEFDSLAPGASVTITYTALVTAAAGVTLNNAAQVQFTSLPGTNGETQNPTGSVTPGNGAANDGERKGCGCGEPGLNNYRDDDDAALTVLGGPGGPNSIGGLVFGDTNENGVYDAGDALLEGVAIDLYDAATGQVIATRFTDANGAYTFTNVADGTYHLVERNQPDGYNDGMEFVGTAGGVTGPNNGLGTDFIDDITLAGGVQATGYLFGECPCDNTEAQLSGYVFVDNNDNCLFDAGDVGIPGVTVTLTGTTLTGGTVNLTTTTDANGFYQFTGLLAGTYTVTETQPTVFQGVNLLDGCDTAGSTGGTVGPNNGRGTDTISNIQIVGGDNSVNNNFGEICDVPVGDKGRISGYVYYDENCDGVKNGGDRPISGVTVNLFDAAGTLIATTTTDASGFYQFLDLDPGNYRVEEVQPTVFEGDTIVDGIDRAGTGGGTVGPNQGVGTDFITGITVVANGEAAQNNFFECKPAINPGLVDLSGHVYFDANCNCVFDSGDTPISGVTVNLFNAAGQLISSATTDANGFYLFSQLQPGTYSVEEVQPATNNQGVALVDGCDKPGTAGGEVGPNNGVGSDFIRNIVLTTTGSQNNDFYECPQPSPEKGSLSGHVYFDANCNCVFDSGDTPISGVTVNLLNSAGQVVATTTTNANGEYTFTNLDPGSYRVEEVQPATNNQGVPVVDGCDKPGTGGGTVGPNNGVGTDFITNITVTAGQNAQNNDFYECPNPTPEKGSLSGHVYFDANCNCVFDSGDTPISGVTVRLLNSAGQVVATTTTNANGEYLFTNLDPGNYRVEEVQPATNNAGQPVVDGCDKAGTGGGTVGPNQGVGTDFITGITVVANQTAANNDFYECPPPVVTPGTISGYVFCYTGTGTNVRTVLSTPIPGVTVILSGTTATGQFINRTAVTDATGLYTFTNVAPGTYTVREIQPPQNILGPGLSVTDGDDSIEVVGGSNTVTPFNDIHPGIVVTGPNTVQTFYNFGEMCTGAVAATTALDGYVYLDANRNCLYDRDAAGNPINGDLPIQGVVMFLTGTTLTGQAVSRTAVTNEAGFYRFTDLEAGTYTVTQTQPNTFVLNGQTFVLGDYCENPGTTGGTTGPNNGIGTSNQIVGIPLPPDRESNQNNFGEVIVNAPPGPNPLPPPINKGQLLSSTRAGGTQNNAVAGVTVIGTAAQAPTFTNAAGTLGRGNPNAVRYLVTGTDVGGGPVVRVFDFQTGVERASFLAYDANFTGGVRVASADVTGDGIADIITAAGTGGGPHVRVFDGRSFQLVREFMAYGADFRGGVYIAAADVTGDGIAEIITGAGEGGAGHVKVFNTVGQFAEFFAYDMAFRGGVRVAAADFNADGRADIATGAGVGGGPHVCVFDLAQPVGGSFRLLTNIMAFDPNFRGGVFVSANNTSGNGDANGDGRPDLVVGAGTGGQALVNVYSGVDFSSISSFLAYDASFTGGARVGLLDANGDGRADVIVGTGAGKGAFVRLVDLVSTRDLEFFQAYAPAYLGGVFVAGA